MNDFTPKDVPQQWRCWPARERPLAGLMACALIMLLAWSVLLATGDWMWGTLTLMGMFMALPTDVLLSSDTIIIREPLRVRSMRWDSIQLCKDVGDALLFIQQSARRSRHGRMQVPLGRGDLAHKRKRAIEDLWQRFKLIQSHADQSI